ncbi:unnamed protein product [Schistosoma rodhaini]|uniref:Uncharacterized protein n=2 Tax=Schistosoma rodhaini TaxID=6188 RepID=A0AA85FFF3_9TREM|nr:unnamed protein product [Schistosoma rodhaini]
MYCLFTTICSIKSGFLPVMDSNLQESKNNQTAVEDTYQQMRKLCENYKLFAKMDNDSNDLDELYSTSLNLSYIRDDYETIKHELSVIKANRQIARDALLAAGFQCPDDPPTS